MFGKFFDWLGFNVALVRQYRKGEIIGVFDPAYIKKSGQQTYGAGTFWSSVAGKALKGWEVGCLCFVDGVAGTALHGLAEQPPAPQALKQKGKTLIDH